MPQEWELYTLQSLGESSNELCNIFYLWASTVTLTVEHVQPILVIVHPEYEIRKFTISTSADPVYERYTFNVCLIHPVNHITL
jgi:hypothetical protein